MGKKKVYDSESGEVLEVGGGGDNSPKPSDELIESFCAAYTPCANEGMADEVFTIGKLREYFGCFMTVDPRWIDLLSFYLKDLERRGYRMMTSFMGEPAIFVTFNLKRAYDFSDEEEDV